MSSFGRMICVETRETRQKLPSVESTSPISRLDSLSICMHWRGGVTHSRTRMVLEVVYFTSRDSICRIEVRIGAETPSHGPMDSTKRQSRCRESESRHIRLGELEAGIRRTLVSSVSRVTDEWLWWSKKLGHSQDDNMFVTTCYVDSPTLSYSADAGTTWGVQGGSHLAGLVTATPPQRLYRVK